MVWFYHSPEGVDEYKKIGLDYPKTVFDVNYDLFIEKTKRSAPEINKTRISSMTRIKSSFGAKDEGEATEEYLVYTLKETRFDSLGNEIGFTRTNLGRYPVPIGIYRIKRDQQGYEEKYTAGVSRIITGYSIPFTKANLNKLRKYCVDKGNDRTQYSVQVEGEQREYAVKSPEDFENKKFEDIIKPPSTTSEDKQQSQSSSNIKDNKEQPKS